MTSPPPAPLVRLGTVIRERRGKLEMTQRELARRSKLHVNYVSGIEGGSRNPTVISLTKVAEALDIEVWQLLKAAEI